MLDLQTHQEILEEKDSTLLVEEEEMNEKKEIQEKKTKNQKEVFFDWPGGYY